ncbi:hypothetical protein BASA81_010695 [Batrachochytrium salamandrivorans]|nr:hypothetical protein BASA81_010695 [Batrachochytrium salamandrivorans]
MVMSAPFCMPIPSPSAPVDVPFTTTNRPKALVSSSTLAVTASHLPSPIASPALPVIPLPETRAQQHLHNKVLHPDFLARYAITQELGSGGFGFVCAAVRYADRQEVAVKFIIRSKIARTAWAVDQDLGSVPMEVYILKNVRHSNIINFLDYYADADFCYLITELHGSSWSAADQNIPDVMRPISPCSSIGNQAQSPLTTTNSHPGNAGTGGLLPYISSRPSMDLFECIEKHEYFTEAQARHVFRQIMSAIAYMQSLRLVHRDIKDENVLIDDNFNVKLIDFGSASFFDEIGGRQFDRFLGTIQYAAPEILKSQKYRGPEAEVWSLGCCLYIMLTGQVPFTSASHAVNRHYSRSPVPLSESCTDLLNSMLDKSFLTRATVQTVLSHSWFNQ